MVWLQKPGGIGGCVGGGNKSYFLAVKLFSPWSSSVRVILKQDIIRTMTKKVDGGGVVSGQKRKARVHESNRSIQKFKKSLDLKLLKEGSPRGIPIPIVLAVLFPIAKRLKQPKYPPTDVVYQYNGMLVSLQKERDSDTRYNMDVP